VEETVDTVKETVGSATETVDQTVEDGSEVIGDAASGVVGTVQDTVDGLLGKDKDPNPGGGDAEDRRVRRDRAPGGSRRPEGLSTHRLEPRDLSMDSFFRGEGPIYRGRLVTPPGPSGIQGAIGAAAKLAFPVLLASMVLAFLLIQNHLDRKDPRLASAPLGPDLLSFE
jgi:hypothetical protein